MVEMNCHGNGGLTRMLNCETRQLTQTRVINLIGSQLQDDGPIQLLSGADYRLNRGKVPNFKSTNRISFGAGGFQYVEH